MGENSHRRRRRHKISLVTVRIYNFNAKRNSREDELLFAIKRSKNLNEICPIFANSGTPNYMRPVSVTQNLRTYNIYHYYKRALHNY